MRSLPAKACRKPIVVTYPQVDKELLRLRRLCADLDERVKRLEGRSDRMHIKYKRPYTIEADI